MEEVEQAMGDIKNDENEVEKMGIDDWLNQINVMVAQEQDN